MSRYGPIVNQGGGVPLPPIIYTECLGKISLSLQAVTLLVSLVGIFLSIPSFHRTTGCAYRSAQEYLFLLVFVTGCNGFCDLGNGRSICTGFECASGDGSYALVGGTDLFL